MEARAGALAAAKQSQYWLVASPEDLQALCRGEVAPPIRDLALGLWKRDLEESAEAYLARVGWTEE